MATAYAKNRKKYEETNRKKIQQKNRNSFRVVKQALSYIISIFGCFCRIFDFFSFRWHLVSRNTSPHAHKSQTRLHTVSIEVLHFKYAYCLRY